MNIHPTAIISPDAKLGEGVQIGPYTIIGPSVTIGKNSIIAPTSSSRAIRTSARDAVFFSLPPLGGLPQDLKYKGEETRVVIGNFNVIREYVTINRATSADIGVTIMGDHNLIMAYSHIAHNCKLGNYVIMGQFLQPGGPYPRGRFCHHQRPDGRSSIHQDRHPLFHRRLLGRCQGRAAVRHGVGNPCQALRLESRRHAKKGF